MKWLNAKATGNVGEIYIYGEITDFKWWDEDVTPTSIKEELDTLKDVDSIKLYVNSPGGGVFAGVAIFSALKRLNKPITAYIDGVAASIASLIVLAADKVVIPTNGAFIIHNVWSYMCGNAKEFREVADKLDIMTETVLIAEYAKKTGIDKAKIQEMLDAETWIYGEEAVELGFADELAEEQKIAACYTGNNISFNNVEIDLKKFKSFSKDKFTEYKPKNRMNLEQRHRHTMNMFSATI